MIQGLYTLKDMIAEYHTPPFVSNNDTSAIRAVEQAVRSGKGMIGQYPEHFHLYCVGEFNDATGEVKSEEHKLVAQCSFMKPKEIRDIKAPEGVPHVNEE